MIEWLDSVTGLGQVAAFLGYVVFGLVIILLVALVFWQISAKFALWTDVTRAMFHWYRCPNGKNRE